MGAARAHDPAGPVSEAGATQNIRKRSVVVAGHKTSVSLEDAFWRGLSEIAAGRGTTVARLVDEIDRRRQGNLSSAIRVFVLKETRARAARAKG